MRLTGQLLGSRYRLETLLGQGGMGSVYAATDQQTGARVAVKILHAEALKDASTRDDKSKLTRFQREAKAASAIVSDHVARVLDWGTDEETQQPFMVMELLVGEDLQQVLKRLEVLPPDVALRIVAQACEGLMKAHEARITHRDIKPANLFLTRGPAGQIDVKILDFGIAKIRPEAEVSNDTTNLTRTGSMLGSPRYMSPEQARGNRSLDHRTDVWSLGVVLYRTLTGHIPHEQAEAVGDFIVMLCSEAPRAVRKYSPWVPDAMAAIVDGAMQIDRERRFPTAEAMRAAMLALLPNGDGIRADEIVGVHPAMRTSTTPGPIEVPSGDVTVPLQTGRRPPRRDEGPTPNTLTNSRTLTVSPSRRALAPIAVAVAATLLGILTVGVVRSMGPTQAASGSGVEGATSGTARSAANRRANLVIFPLDAKVEVDGVAVTAQDGIVELTGALGSVHRVRLTRGGQEKSSDVVLGESGAEPPKVELPVAAPSATSTASGAPSGGPGRVTTKKTAAPSGTSAPGPVKNPLIPERFE